MDEIELQNCLKKRYGTLPTRFERIGGGKNSCVYRCEIPGGPALVLKNYHRDPRDSRDRLGVESGAFAFLWRHGVRQIPEPLWVDRMAGCAAYEAISGSRIDCTAVGPNEILECVNFLKNLNQLRGVPESRQLPLASEACFSFSQAVDNIEKRLQRLETAGIGSSLTERLQEFLNSEFRPFLTAARSEKDGRDGEIWWDKELPWDERCLSPSDFGFHNALQRPSGGFVFLDFEYFGWDDPAKLIVDFLHHPGMRLTQDCRQLFVEQALDLFDDRDLLRQRLPAAYILFGLKWCMILLNEFVPEGFARRQFSSSGGESPETIQGRQLDHARELLRHLQGAMERFPYGL